MKHLISLISLLLVQITCFAQATSLVIDNQTPGWLSSKINYGDQLTVEDIQLTGYLNATDLDFLRQLNTNRNLHGMINLEEARIVKGGSMKDGQYTVENDDELPSLAFSDLKPLRKFIYPKNAIVKYGTLNKTLCDTVIITNPNLESISLGNYVLSEGSKPCKFLYIPDGVKSIPSATGNVYGMSIRFPSSFQSITAYGGMSNCRIFAEMTNPEVIYSKYETYYSTGTSSSRQYHPAISNSTIYVPKGLLDAYKDSDLGNNTIIEYYDIDSIQTDKGISLYIDDTYKLNLTAYPDNQLVKSFVYDCENPEIISIAENKITGLKVGTTILNISAQPFNKFYNGSSTSINIKVFAHVTGIQIPQTLNIQIHQSEKLNCTLYPIDQTESRILWESDNPAIASVDDSGNITGISQGNCIITATSVDGGFTAECVVRVTQPVESVSVSPSNISLKATESANLKVSITPNEADDKSVIWKSDNEDIVKVDENGTLIAISGGTTKVYAISVSNPEIMDYCTVTVIQPVTGIYLSPNSLEITEGGSVQLIANVIPSNATNKNVNWSSSDSSVAIASGNGVIYGLKEGETMIIASTEDGGYIAMCRVTVTRGFVPVENILLDTTNYEGVEGDMFQLNATVQPEEASNKVLLWQSSDNSIASVDNNGFVRLLKEGNADITATSTDNSGTEAHCYVSVKKSSSINDINIADDDLVEIYDLMGNLIYLGKLSNATLQCGFYIIIHNGSPTKAYIN